MLNVSGYKTSEALTPLESSHKINRTTETQQKSIKIKKKEKLFHLHQTNRRNRNGKIIFFVVQSNGWGLLFSNRTKKYWLMMDYHKSQSGLL